MITDKFNLIFLLVIIFIIQVFKFIFFAPDIEFGGDAIRYWVYAKDLKFDIQSFVNSSDLIEIRWGIWLLPNVLINIFSSDVKFYYLSSFISFNLSLIIFTIIIHNLTNLRCAMIFALIIIIDALLYRFNFQLLPSTMVLLPLSICIYFFINFLNSENEKYKNISFFISVLSLFWMYGVKETNIFFSVGFFLYLIIYEKKYLKYFIFLFSLFYLIETIVLSILIDEFSVLGKIHHLIAHKSDMTYYLKNNAELDKFYDRGITNRWYTARMNHSVLFFLSFVAIIYFFSSNFTEKNKNIIFISFLATSFVICTSFFIISLDPIFPGQPYFKRYTAPYVPIAYILTIYFINNIFKSKKLVFNLGFLFIFIFYISQDINGIIFNIKYFEYKVQNIKKHFNYYNNLHSKLERADCIITKNGKKLKYSLHLIPNEKRNNKINKILTTPWIKEGNKKILYINEKCEKKFKM